MEPLHTEITGCIYISTKTTPVNHFKRFYASKAFCQKAPSVKKAHKAEETLNKVTKTFLEESPPGYLSGALAYNFRDLCKIVIL